MQTTMLKQSLCVLLYAKYNSPAAVNGSKILVVFFANVNHFKSSTFLAVWSAVFQQFPGSLLEVYHGKI